MRKIIILSAATLILSSCGIYNKYKPVSEVPEGLYGSETVVSADTANFGNLSWREVFTDSYLQNLIDRSREESSGDSQTEWMKNIRSVWSMRLVLSNPWDMLIIILL